MEREDIINNFNSFYNVIIDTNLSKVFREELGSYSLISFGKEIEEILESLKYIYDKPNNFGNDFFTKAASFAIKLAEVLKSIIILQDSQYTERFKLNNIKLQNIIYDFIDLRDIVRLKQTDKSEILKILNDLETIKGQAEETRKLKENLDNLDARYAEMFPKLELSKQRQIFKEAAERNKNESNWWLFGIIISFIILVILIWIIFKHFCFEASCFNITELKNFNTICDDCGVQVLWLEIFKALIFRLLIISIALYILAFTVKNYNNSKHNFTINSHKQNSFEAAIVLIDHTDKGKDEIISKAAQAIFSQQKTGYIAKENDNINSGLVEQIINLKKEI